MNLKVNFAIEDGQLVTLYGDSGAGKTSILRMVSGLMKPDGGQILINGEPWYDSGKGINIKTQKRKVGFVFQDYALFPNMTILENLRFALSKRQSEEVIHELIELIELGDLRNKLPFTLSGGQQQRVALARALVQKPEILLLDEPLSALDLKIRLKLQDYIIRVHKQYSLTTLLVSHDVGEISKLSSHVMILEEGKIVRQGIPSDIFGNENISGKFKFTGEILNIEAQDVVYIVSVLIQNELVKVIAQEEEVKEFSIGDKVVVASKAFNPVIYKID